MLALTPAQKIALAAVALLLLAAGGVRLATALSSAGEEVVYIPAPDAQAPLQVHVVGGVMQPGVYRLPPGARVHDAVRAAGGLAPNARPESVNLAAFVEDGQQIVVGNAEPPAPVAGEAGAAPEERSSETFGTAAVGPPAGATAAASAPSPAAVSPGPSVPPTPTSPPQPVCINTAGLEELKSLPGIGEKLAMRILYYRHEHGQFRSVEQLVEVPGIGPATLEKIRPYITLQ